MARLLRKPKKGTTYDVHFEFAFNTLQSLELQDGDKIRLHWRRHMNSFKGSTPTVIVSNNSAHFDTAFDCDCHILHEANAVACCEKWLKVSVVREGSEELGEVKINLSAYVKISAASGLTGTFSVDQPIPITLRSAGRERVGTLEFTVQSRVNGQTDLEGDTLRRPAMGPGSASLGSSACSEQLYSASGCGTSYSSISGTSASNTGTTTPGTPHITIRTASPPPLRSVNSFSSAESRKRTVRSKRKRTTGAASPSAAGANNPMFTGMLDAAIGQISELVFPAFFPGTSKDVAGAGITKLRTVLANYKVCMGSALEGVATEFFEAVCEYVDNSLCSYLTSICDLCVPDSAIHLKSSVSQFEEWCRSSLQVRVHLPTVRQMTSVLVLDCLRDLKTDSTRLQSVLQGCRRLTEDTVMQLVTNNALATAHYQ